MYKSNKELYGKFKQNDQDTTDLQDTLKNHTELANQVNYLKYALSKKKRNNDRNGFKIIAGYPRYNTKSSDI